MKCFLDLDGVLVNFVGGALKLLGKTLDPYPAGEWNFYPHVGLTEWDFWAKIDRYGAHFWSSLEWMPDGREILAAVEKAFGSDNICLLTSPSWSPHSAEGKVAWIRRELPAYAQRFLIGAAKEFVASWDSLLIDDHDGNVSKFRAAGGNAVLVPRPWNRLHQLYATGLTVDVVAGEAGIRSRLGLVKRG